MIRMKSLTLCFTVLALAASPARAVTVWSGEVFSFTKPFQTPASDPAARDQVIPGVVLTRGLNMGLFNYAAESQFTSFVSPTGTRWAFPANNPGLTVRALNWQGLSFANWQTAHDKSPLNTVGQDAVLHLIDADIYVDIRFTTWDQNFGGGFSYERAVSPADLDIDADVDDADFGIAFAAFTGPGNGPSSNPSADLDGDSDVDDADFGLAFAAFTGPGGSSVTVPEPASLVVMSLCGWLMSRRRCPVGCY